MELVWDSWAAFLFVCMILIGLLQIIGKSRSSEVQPGMATKSDQFSMRTVFLSVRSGEALLFFTVLAITISFFLFALGFCHYLASMLP